MPEINRVLAKVKGSTIPVIVRPHSTFSLTKRGMLVFETSKDDVMEVLRIEQTDNFLCFSDIDNQNETIVIECNTKYRINEGKPSRAIPVGSFKVLALRAVNAKKGELFIKDFMYINSNIEFKRINLIGKRCKVLHKIDRNYVFVELDEDIGAMSCDGTGKSGHCIVVPKNCLVPKTEMEKKSLLLKKFR